MFPTMALCFILLMCSKVMIPLFPVEVTQISMMSRTSSILTTSKPSIQACRAQMGSTSVTQTLAPLPLKAWAHPFPTSPKPQTSVFLPVIMTSVALLMPSMTECLQPQMLSNLDLVTESLTLMQGQSSLLSFSSLQSLATPVVVSSETPFRFLDSLVKQCLSCWRYLLMVLYSQYSSSDCPRAGSASCSVSLNFFSTAKPSIRQMVASPPSSTIMSGPCPSPQLRQSLVSSQYSSRVSPFQAKTAAVLASAMAEAAWSWVEKMLQEHHLTCAPRWQRVSMRTPVWMVMWREPDILAPCKGLVGPNSQRMDIKPGISTSASQSSFLPQLASDRSLTLDISTLFFDSNIASLEFGRVVIPEMHQKTSNIPKQLFLIMDGAKLLPISRYPVICIERN